MKNIILSAMTVLAVLAVFSFTASKEKSETLLIVTHEVKDFDAWKAVFNAGEEMRSKSGIHAQGVYRALDNPNMVTVVSSVSDMEGMKKLTNSPEMKQAMEKAGVISKPEVKIIQKAF